MPAAPRAETSGPESGGEDFKGKNPVKPRQRRLFMCSCNCNCQQKDVKPAATEAEFKSYLCHQCNTFKNAPPEAAAPECCGKKMQEMD
jgi:hypothetical protein